MDNPIDELQGVLGAMRQVSAISTSPSGCVFSIEASVPRSYPSDLLRRSLTAIVTLVDEAVQTGEDVDLESYGGWLSVRVLDGG